MHLDRQGCVILAAGEGKRMHSPRSKVLCEVAFKPLLSWVIDAAKRSGIKDIAVVASSDDVKKAAEGCEIYEQKERLGTGHAVMCAGDFIKNHGENILVLCGDAPFIDTETIIGAFKAHAEKQNDVTVISAIVANAKGYGRIVRKDGALAAIVEDADCDDDTRRISEINAGAYWFKSKSLAAVLDNIKNDNVQGEYYLTDAVEISIKEGKGAGCYIADSADIALGANTPADILLLNEIAREKTINKYLENGVMFLGRDGIIISPDVEIAAGATIMPGCMLSGATKVGSGSIIGPNTTLHDTVIGSGSRINACQCTESTVGDGVTMGPWVQLRPNSHIGNSAKIGDFVEIKNSTIGEGTAVAHLTYVGDSDIGRYCNFGCGVVFVNYDGESKNRAIIKDYAFVGCNTNIIAPVTIGEGAYTAAGATITEDVPDGALAIGRAKQENKTGWAKKKLGKYIEKKSR